MGVVEEGEEQLSDLQSPAFGHVIGIRVVPVGRASVRHGGRAVGEDQQRPALPGPGGHRLGDAQDALVDGEIPSRELLRLGPDAWVACRAGSRQAVRDRLVLWRSTLRQAVEQLTYRALQFPGRFGLLACESVLPLLLVLLLGACGFPLADFGLSGRFSLVPGGVAPARRGGVEDPHDGSGASGDGQSYQRDDVGEEQADERDEERDDGQAREQ